MDLTKKLNHKTMELSGLKDKDGNEYVLNVSVCNGKVVEVDGLYKKQPEPKFKVGDWVCIIGYKESSAGRDTLNCVGRIFEKYDDGSGYKVDFFNEHAKWSYMECNIRLATKDEIESHLRKIADEKYPRGTSYYDVGTTDKIVVQGDFEYYSNQDQLTDGCGGSVYFQGKWAEIVPSKKKLPKNRQEFTSFLTDWLKDDNDGFVFLNDNEEEWNDRINKFLNKYED